MLLVDGVLVEEETVLAVSGFLAKKVMILHGSVTLAKVKEMVLSSNALAVTWCSWGLFS